MCTAVGFRASAENNHESRVQFVRIIILLIVNVIYKKKQSAKKLPILLLNGEIITFGVSNDYRTVSLRSLRLDSK